MARVAVPRPQGLAQQLRRRIVRSGDHRGDSVDKPDPRDVDCLGGQPLERDIRDEAARSPVSAISVLTLSRYDPAAS
jgi:hypothetical protein